jgi:hypothetical protein
MLPVIRNRRLTLRGAAALTAYAANARRTAAERICSAAGVNREPCNESDASQRQERDRIAERGGYSFGHHRNDALLIGVKISEMPSIVDLDSSRIPRGMIGLRVLKLY